LGLLLASSCFRKYSDKKNTNKTEKLYLHAISGTVLHYVLAKSREVSFKLVLRHLYLAHVVEFLFREFFNNGIVLLLFDIPLGRPLQARGPVGNTFAGPRSVACAEIFEGGIKSQ